MATLTPTLTITTTDTLTSDAVSISQTDQITIGDNDMRVNAIISPNDVDPGGTQIIDTNLGRAHVYVKNIHSTLTMYLAPAADTATGSCYMSLLPGEFAFFPWTGGLDLFVHTGANGQGVGTEGFEYFIWEV
jgi:hypothetical protein